MYIYNYISLTFPRMRNVSDKGCKGISPYHHLLYNHGWALASYIEIKNKYYLFSNFFLLIRSAYEIMWGNIVERSSLQMTIWRMRSACWMSKATYIQS